MKRTWQVERAALDELQRGRPCVLATILSLAGSAPRTAGAKMLVRADGTIAGTIGGGRLEAEVMAEAGKLLGSSEGLTMRFDLTGADAGSMDMICGGRLETLLEPLTPSPEAVEPFAAFLAAMDAGRRGARSFFVLSLAPAADRTGQEREAASTPPASRAGSPADSSSSGPTPPLAFPPFGPPAGAGLPEKGGPGKRVRATRRFVTTGVEGPDVKAGPPLSIGLIERLLGEAGRERGPTVVSPDGIDGTRFVVEPTTPPGMVWLFGAGHVSQKLAHVAAFCGLRVAVLDDRAEFANQDRFPEADEILVPASFDGLLGDGALDGHGDGARGASGAERSPSSGASTDRLGPVGAANAGAAADPSVSVGRTGHADASGPGESARRTDLANPADPARRIGPFGEDDCLVIVTRGHRHDKDILAQALRTGAGYIGMIGSRRKRHAVYEALRLEGFSDEDFRRVHCPIGLDIGAETPEEIAVSVMAELIFVRAGRGGA